MVDLLNRSPSDGTISHEAVRAQEMLYKADERPADGGNQGQINTYQQAEASLQNYQNQAQQPSAQDSTEIINFDSDSGGAV